MSRNQRNSSIFIQLKKLLQEFIRSIEDQILIFEEYYYLVSLLKNEAFNDRYWDVIFKQFSSFP